MLYNENAFYVTDLVTGRCRVRELCNSTCIYMYVPPHLLLQRTEPFFPWQPYEIPPDATFEGEYTIGGGECLITAVEFSDRVGPSRKYFPRPKNFLSILYAQLSLGLVRSPIRAASPSAKSSSRGVRRQLKRR